ncbi:LysE family translocator [Brevibacillus laterosporus]|uniref:LysE family translocator n=1 Tax=Brevibacillus laterosporus TaxID=1465 RepID=UPI00264BA38B|nr:LysE family transporter [Brevibacillus laterosporus]MDN9009096.1 LysE family transporter [Brevibacillus laterosporus]MDO0942549.1 LysE family transporter [Brevibacillus laterosporus]
MLVNGFKFGMMLQFAIGPICIFIFQISALQGFFTAITGVLGVTFIDGLFILAAILGIATVMDNGKIKSGFRLFGAAVLFMLGLNLVLSLFETNFLSSLSIVYFWDIKNVFVYSIILAASNPLTILFWAGVFSTKVIEDNIKKKDIYVFGVGALFATVFFLTLVAFVGSLAGVFVTTFVVQMLNITVGIVFIYFAVKMIFKQTVE